LRHVAGFLAQRGDRHVHGGCLERAQCRRSGLSQELDVARRRVEQVRELGFDKPLAWDGEYPSLRARRQVQYSKGALFLAHLRETIGEVAFWAGLRSFTRQHAGGTVTSKDFQTAMERASGRDLSATFAEWVYGG
jgi:hypothetical protein